ncbi:MAG: alpha/beta hydrolase [Pseudomonadota bacterium]
MASLRSKFVKWRLRRIMKAKPLHQIDSAIMQAEAEAAAPKRVPKSVSVETVSENAMDGEWHRPRDASTEQVILFFHGGGYYFGSAKSHRALTFELCKRANADVFSLNYRLAPEHVFPAAVDDALAAYQRLLDRGISPGAISFAGDSAGGGLALALTSLLKQKSMPFPACLVVYSPWTDLAVTGASVEENAETDAMFKPIYIREGAKTYLNGADPKSPLASPLYADAAGFPPTLIFASDDEILRDDSVRMHERLKAAGVSSTLVMERSLPHVWPLFAGLMPEAARSIEQSAQFMRKHTGRAGSS